MRPSIFSFIVGSFVTWAALTEQQAREQRAIEQAQAMQSARAALSMMLVAATKQSKSRATVSAGRNGQYYVDGVIDKRTERFLVDTGAADVALRFEVAEALGLHWEDGRRKCYGSAHGTVCARTFLAPKVSVAGISKSNVVVAMFPKDALSTNLLGMSFLSKLTHYEFKRGVLELEE